MKNLMKQRMVTTFRKRTFRNKDIPMNTGIQGVPYPPYVFKCPACKELNVLGDELESEINYCPICGQKLRWEV